MQHHNKNKNHTAAFQIKSPGYENKVSAWIIFIPAIA